MFLKSSCLKCNLICFKGLVQCKMNLGVNDRSLGFVFMIIECKESLKIGSLITLGIGHRISKKKSLVSPLSD